ncbi:hypothetical protein SUGI_0592530 [Cryptomeria japonica]|uniref:uncharacterized protein LOC131058894 n=1 Tax=Cryptomeria japonica TaxID=3369 RepID=UPI0024147E73|nr:uncharacterized protein LOC131058894 [Cryptomeria japonica]GLJ29968.1 hypothetical protein SUGI_0592530 [Cryptomeria japonica]
MASSKLQGSVETKVMAPLEVVWKIVSEFYESHKWFPGMKSCERVEGAPEKGVGSVRRCVTSGQEGSDSFGVEELIAVDDSKHSYSYRLTDTNMQGFDGYQATIKVSEAKEAGNCLLKWSFELDPAGHSKEDTEALFSSILTAMAKNLEQLASSQ